MSFEIVRLQPGDLTSYRAFHPDESSLGNENGRHLENPGQRPFLRAWRGYSIVIWNQELSFQGIERLVCIRSSPIQSAKLELYRELSRAC